MAEVFQDRSRGTHAQHYYLLSVSVLILVAAGNGPAKVDGAKFSVDEIVARHLESIASPESCTVLRPRFVQFDSHNGVILAGAGKTGGMATLASQGRIFELASSIASIEYPGERFLSGGTSSTGGSPRGTAFHAGGLNYQH